MELKKELCNKLIEENLVEEGDMIVHSYANNRLSGKRPINTTQNKDKNVSAVLTTRPDTLGIVVNDGDGITLFESEDFGGVKVQKQISPTIRAEKVCAGVVRMGGLFDTEEQTHQAGSIYDTEGLAPNIDTMQGGYRQPLVPWYAVAQRGREDGQNIEISDREYANAITTAQKDSMVGEPQSCLIQPIDRDYSRKGDKRETHVETKTDGTSHALRTNGETMTTNGLRIRKLTPKECWRLMYWDDESFEKAEKVNSASQLYKQAGNGICVNVMSAIFKELL